MAIDAARRPAEIGKIHFKLVFGAMSQGKYGWLSVHRPCLVIDNVTRSEEKSNGVFAGWDRRGHRMW